ncbi:hypothetical protein HYDPIDRAFT_173393 [Hydnomerulius pinastri MD-312]|nr:hypothetical protein HYDPIDRAFT_173393 [Hydnomerulius pinastri MD-312]
MTAATEPYDVNFSLPVRELENDRVKVTPFIPSLHAELMFEGSISHPELFDHISFGPAKALDEWTDQVFEPSRSKSNRILYAIIDKTRSPSPDAPVSAADFAGIIGYILPDSSSIKMLSAELGPIMVLPPFQRTHVATHAMGLLIQYALDLPSAGGLGLRRLQYQTDENNETSTRMAERLGFKKEALLRWDRVAPGDVQAHNGIQLREGDARPGTVGRNTYMLSLCWDDWEGGEREKLREQMERRS